MIFNYLSIIFLLTGLLSQMGKIHAIEAKLKNNPLMERWSKASKNQNWTFEVKNKLGADMPVSLKIVDGDKNIVVDSTKIGASKGYKEQDQGYLRIADIDPTKEYYLFFEAYKIPNKAELDPSTLNFKRDASSKAIYKWTTKIVNDPKRRKIFIKLVRNDIVQGLDKGKYRIYVLPQDGVGIIKKMSQSGVDLSNNIDSGKMKKITHPSTSYADDLVKE